ncbi:hypothetical protein WMY93_033132 [Mugilogobius chulae]|uniref:L1 transposable element RRM domain-containing protein n=1 Tax=Mugilogobius chulae TaxID=88201 RepID=A0AAW0ML26_9GOBI
MANPVQASASDHDYDIQALNDGCREEIVEMEQAAADVLFDLNSPNPKRTKKRSAIKKQDDVNLSHAVQSILTRFDGLDGKLENIECRMDGVQTTLKKFDVLEKKLEGIENRIDKIGQKQILREKCLESERYKRRWDLRLVGVPEKDNEDTRDVVIGILTRVVPMSVEKLRDTVDTVHRLGKKGAVNNNMPRTIIIQFAMRTVRDEVWRKSKEARVCKEMKINFREDFSKDDREARAKLWPQVEQARRNGKKAYLKDGYALIDGRKVMP